MIASFLPADACGKREPVGFASVASLAAPGEPQPSVERSLSHAHNATPAPSTGSADITAKAVA